MKKHTGYAVVKKIGSSYVICLFDWKREDLEWAVETCGFKGVEIVEFYEEGERRFIKKNEEFIEV